MKICQVGRTFINVQVRLHPPDTSRLCYTFPMSIFKVHVCKDYRVFCAVHFAIDESECEPLHGHNDRASVTEEGRSASYREG